MTIDTSREAVERLVKTHDNFEDYPDLYDMGKRPPCKKTAQVLTALLAERDAALAEVARLSSPPDDADTDVAGLIERLRHAGDHASFAPSLHHIAACAITRLSHAHEGERKLADDLCLSLQFADIRQELGGFRNPHRTAVIAAHAARRKEQTLAKHGSKT